MRVPRPPSGVRPGQVSLLVLGRVIMGDMAVTMVDLASRSFVRIEADRDLWILRPAPVPGYRRESLLAYERTLLDALARRGPETSLTEDLGPDLAKVHTGLVKEAVRQGWIRRLRHDRRTGKGDEVAARLSAFEGEMRGFKASAGVPALTGDLLPWALHYALVPRDSLPLARFADAWVHELGGLPGWRHAPRRRGQFSDAGMYDPPLQAG
jgi:hypothetical protein